MSKEDLKANPEWANTDSSWVVYYLRQDTIFDADRVGAMMDFAAECAKRGYTTPQQRKPLTDEQRREIILKADTVGQAIAMVEAAHGIKGKA